MSPQHQVKSASLGSVVQSFLLAAAIVVGCYLLQDCLCLGSLSRLLLSLDPEPSESWVMRPVFYFLDVPKSLPNPLCGQALLSPAALFICTVASPGFLSCPHGVHSRALCFVAESRSHGPCQLPVSPSLPGRQPESQHSVETKAFLEVRYPQEKHPWPFFRQVSAQTLLEHPCLLFLQSHWLPCQCILTKGRG